MTDSEIEMTEPIQGKVAQIMSERELAVNVGSLNGVHRDMKFKIMAGEPIEVRDPDTGDKLGIVDRDKVRVMATEVQDKFSICRTYGRWGRLDSYLSSLTGLGLLLGQRSEKGETLKIDDSSLPQPLPEEESYVKVGDRAIQVTEERE